ncbi:MAG: DUF1499 domain-containing protein [Bacteroidota bacterium]
MRKGLIGLGILVLVIAGGALASRLLSQDTTSFGPDPGPFNPLPTCPDSPNCVRVTWTYEHPPELVFDELRQALDETGGILITADEQGLRVETVYRALFFNDDVVAVVETAGEGASVHLRSASRVGYSDLGVNGRRVRRLQRALDQRL